MRDSAWFRLVDGIRVTCVLSQGRCLPNATCATPGQGECGGWCGDRCGPRCCASAAWLAGKVAALGGGSANQSQEQAQRDGGRRRIVMIWQGERNDDGRLGFMYWPAVGTLLRGFREAQDVELVVGLGFSTRWLASLKRLRPGDAYLYVGIAGMFGQPWRQLRNRGVRTVYYQSEPARFCKWHRHRFDELWDYSQCPQAG